MKALFVVLGGTIPDEKPETNISDEVDALCGIFHDAANPALVPFEKDAWAEAAAEEERRFWEDYNNEDA
ncbi:MAG: hypothetical protein J1E40_07940 [Oscillospiraceae bacterium]|nr:hypothetical protein [Oscillospiraceae bacterium]